jgi:hypothetical protein
MNLTSSTCVRKASISFQRVRMRSSSFGKSIDMAGLCAVLLVPVAGMFFWCLTPRNPPSMTQLSITEPQFHRLPSIFPPPCHHIIKHSRFFYKMSKCLFATRRSIPSKLYLIDDDCGAHASCSGCRDATSQRARNASARLLNDLPFDNYTIAVLIMLRKSERRQSLYMASRYATHAAACETHHSGIQSACDYAAYSFHQHHGVTE